MLAFIFLSACGDGTDKNKDNKAIRQATQQTKPDKLIDGSDLFSKYGCFACHSLDGGVMYGPPLNGLFMKEVSVVRMGKEKTIVADREYLTKAITDPDYEKVSEYKNKIMPKPVIPRDDIETLIDYLIELGEEE
jgi:cytochrome c2